MAIWVIRASDAGVGALVVFFSVLLVFRNWNTRLPHSQPCSIWGASSAYIFSENSLQNLYITNNKNKNVIFAFAHKNNALTIRVESAIMD